MRNSKHHTAKKSEFLLLALFLGVGLIHALIYVFLIPPWQHYDEPTHFEVVWLTAKLGRHPTAEDYDPVFSREVVQSMVDNGFYAGLPFAPDLSAEAEVHIFGYDQFQEQPLYYYLAALPLKLYQSADVANELRATRLVSVLLYLTTIISAWGTVQTITTPGNPLRWMVPGFVVLLPAFTDLMTAVNSDALAVAAFSFFLWGAVRLLKSGYTILNFSWVVLSMILVYFSKNTAYVAFAVLPLVMIIAIFPSQYRRFAWVVALLLGVIGFFFSLKYDDAAYWHRTTAQRDALRQISDQAVHGKYALSLDTWEGSNPPWSPPSYILIPLNISQDLKDQPMTLGFWMWANQPVKVSTPNLGTPLMRAGETILVGETPTFHAFQVTMPPASFRIWIQLRPSLEKQQMIRLYYDGFLLVQGHRPLQEVPQFSDVNATQGTWGGEPFVNMLRNGSIEESWPRVNPRLDALLARILPDGAQPSLILHSILDWPATQVMYKQTYQHMMQTFWARFGWGHVPLSLPFVYQVLNWLFILGIIGALAGIFLGIKDSSWDWALLMLLSAGLIWFADFVRGVGYFTSLDLYIPPARYAFPAIVPTAIVLAFGWFKLAWLARTATFRIFTPERDNQEKGEFRSKSILSYIPAGIYFGGLVFLAVYSLYSISLFYAGIR